MKSLAFATYWLMVFAVFSSVNSYNESLTADSETAPVSYSFNDVNCDTARRAGELTVVASVQCTK